MMAPTIFMVVGDTHGRIKEIERIDRLAAQMNIMLVYQVGDFGISWPRHHCKVLKYFRKRLRNERSGPSWISCLGNHDNYDKLEQLMVKHDVKSGLVPYVTPGDQIGGCFAATRPTAHAANDTNVVLFGGAESTDCITMFNTRKKGISWWEQETPTDNEFADLLHVLQVVRPQVVITHDAPAAYRPYRSPGVNPFSQRSYSHTSCLLQDTYHQLDEYPELWFYGHHHEMTVESNGMTTFYNTGFHGQGYIVVIDDSGETFVIPFNASKRGESQRLKKLSSLQNLINWKY